MNEAPPLEPIRDTHGGLLPEVKRIRFEEIFWTYYDPHLLAPSQKPPAHVQAALEDVFGEVAKGPNASIKLAMHPWFRRWALFEKARKGENTWACFWVCSEDAKPGLLPMDLDVSDHRFEECRGNLGEFKVPDKKDFELLSRCSDKQRNSSDQLVAESAREQLEHKKAQDAYWEARNHDMLSYNFLRISAAANREAGSGWKPYSTATVEVGKSEERWHIEQKNGYTLKVKRGSVAHDRLIEEQAERARTDEARLQELEREAEKADLLRRARAAVYGAQAAKRTL